MQYVDEEIAYAYLIKWASGIKGIITSPWESFGVTINDKGDKSPLDLFELVTHPVPDCEVTNTGAKKEDDNWIPLLLFTILRVGSLNRRDYQELIAENLISF